MRHSMITYRRSSSQITGPCRIFPWSRETLDVRGREVLSGRGRWCAAANLVLNWLGVGYLGPKRRSCI